MAYHFLFSLHTRGVSAFTHQGMERRRGAVETIQDKALEIDGSCWFAFKGSSCQ